MLDRSGWLERFVVAAALLLTVWGIWSFGLWDPWELVPADAARALSNAEAIDGSCVSPATRILGLAFRAFGAQEWSSRLPGVLAGLLTCWLAFAMLRSHCGTQAGVISVAVMASTPLFLLNVRLVMGDWLGIAAQAWVGVAAIAVASGTLSRWRWAACCVLLAVGVTSSALASGVLLGPLPPILAVAVLAVLSEKGVSIPRAARWLFPATAGVLILGVVRAVVLDAPEYTIWLGGGTVGGDPPTWDEALERVFHAFAPWSAALPVAAIWLLAPRRERTDDVQKVAWMLVLWCAFAFAAWTVFASRYGTPPYLALVPLAGMVAIWLSETCEAPVAKWPAAVAVSLLMGLVIRDYALYPSSPLRALAADGLAVPDAYDATPQWVLAFSVAGVTLALTLVSHRGVTRPRARRIVEWLQAQSEAGPVHRIWLLVGALLLGVSFTVGLLTFVLEPRLASIVVRIGRLVFFLPLVLAVLIVGLPWLRYGCGRLGARRAVLALAGALAVGVVVSLSFQPGLSRHFSSREVYQAYGELRRRDEPLATYRLSPTAASYYTDTIVEEISNATGLLRFLAGGGQRWAVVQSDQLPALDHTYRRKTGRHLYVAEAKSARLLLLAAQPIEGRPNQSLIAKAVLSQPPPIQHPVRASYDDRIELLGFDLDLPQADFVGAGQRFGVTWYWRVIGEVPADYQVFLHIDGRGLRINGDHVPVGGRYPTTLWEVGDVIVDAQELAVPPNLRTGEHMMYVGFFKGTERLEVRSGPHDGDDRVRAGALPVR